MRVVVDLLFIRLTVNRGVQTYVDSLLSELAAVPGCDLTCVTNRGNHSWYADELGLPCWSAPVSGRNRVTRVLYQQLQLGAAAQRLGGDVMFCPGYLAPAIPALPTVPALHDMNFRDIPELFPAARRMAYNITARSVARRAAAVITASEFSKERIVSCLDIAPEKISVVHYGPMQISGGPDADWPTVQAKYGVSDNYFLSISSGLPHKNIRRLAQGFVAAQRRAPGGEQLVLVGHRLDGELEAWLGREGFGAAVVATGYVSEAEKAAFLRHGIAYFFPSLYEGFGLPALEAQSCGLPLAASRYGSLPEVCGEGAVYFDAMSVASIADTFLKLRDDRGLRDRLIEAGYANIRRFSWRRAARETLAALRAAVEAS